MLATLFHPTSYLGIIVFLILTGCGMPLPEEIAIVVAGVLSAQEHLRWELALASCLIGAILGDSVLYAIGRRWGRSLLSVHPRIAKLLHAEQEKRFEEAIQRHALKVMILSRFMVGLRGPVHLAAGVMGMPFRKFLLIDSICATLVVMSFFWLSYFFGDNVVAWIHDAEMTATILVFVVLAAVGFYFYRRSRRKLLHVAVGPGGSHDG